MQVVGSRAVAIIGGPGVFGRRLARMLAADGWRVVIAGRDIKKAVAEADAIRGVAARLDRATLTSDQLHELKVDALVDASGPFLLDAQDPYRVVTACLQAGVHYLDIADGRDFICGVSRFDDEARAQGQVIRAGASTTPALSSAVCDVLVQGLTRVDAIEIGVSPGNRAPRGLAVVRSILGYAGRPVRVFQNAQWGSAPGWGLLTRRHIGPGVGGRWLSLCDTADLELFAERYAVKDRVLFRGGLELSLLHLGLTAGSQIVRLGIIRDLRIFAEMARDMADAVVAFGTDRGGMRVDVWGQDQTGANVKRTWRLVAEGGDGPNIPVLAAYACLNKLNTLSPGARPCMGDVTLSEFDALFGRYQIKTETL
jgi:NAD(P)-dependent dehydrogenase (short-subunit alcohol dehydrogenase family)